MMRVVSHPLDSAWTNPTDLTLFPSFLSTDYTPDSIMTSMKNFDNDATLAQLQGISVQLGDIFARVYRDSKQDVQLEGSYTYLSLQILEAYKEVRRCLPREGTATDARHMGASAAHSATQGETLPRHLTNQG